MDTCNAYCRNICQNNEESIICGDVRKIDIESLGDIDALAFVFPCNDFSIVGEQKGFNGTFGTLYTYRVDWSREIIVNIGLTRFRETERGIKKDNK